MAFPYTFLLHVLDINKMAFYNICMFTKMIGSLEVCAKDVLPGDITSLGSHSLCAKILKASTTLITSVVLALGVCCVATRRTGRTSMLKALLVGAFSRRGAEDLAYVGQCLAIDG